MLTVYPPGFDNAQTTFHAATAAPAFERHLAAHNVDPASIHTPADFTRVPPVTKQNYLQKYQPQDLFLDGDITAAGTWSASSGSTGTPTYFARGLRSLRQSTVLYRRIFRSVGAGEVPTLLVIGYAMGGWIGGTYTYQAAAQLQFEGFPMAVATPGADVEEIRSTIARLGPRYQRVIVAGYPPLVRTALEGAGPEVLGQDLRIVLAGEAISEEWRDLILELIGKPGRIEHIALIYGTADAGIMAAETPFSVAVRRLAAADAGLRRRLFGSADPVLPTFVEYDPALRYTEVDDTGALLFTIDGEMPWVRYRIGDLGRVYPASEVGAILREHGYDLPVVTSAPEAGFIVLHRRELVATSFYAISMYPDGVRSALTGPALADRVTGRFQLRTREDAKLRPVLQLAVELRPQAVVEAGFAGVVTRAAVAGMERISSEYRELRSLVGHAADPVVTLLPYGSGEFDGLELPGGSGK